MSIIAYTNQEEYDVVHESQDCRGWTVTDQAGNSIGKVTDLLVDTDKMRVDSIVVDGKARIAAEDITLGDKSIVVRGVHDADSYANVNHTAATATGAGTYSALEDQSQYRGAGHVSGVTRAASDNEITLPIIEENLVVGKRTVEKGGVSVRTTMTETPVSESVNLREENVTVERHKVDRPVDGADAFKESSFDVTTQAEVPVVSKTARVVEEVVIDKGVTEHTETIRDSVKRTDVEVDEFDADDAANRKNG